MISQQFSDDLLDFVTTLYIFPFYCIFFIQFLSITIDHAFDPIVLIIQYLKKLKFDGIFSRILNVIIRTLEREVRKSTLIAPLILYLLLFMYKFELTVIVLCIINMFYINNYNQFVIVLYINTLFSISSSKYVRFFLVIVFVVLYFTEFFQFSMEDHRNLYIIFYNVTNSTK